MSTEELQKVEYNLVNKDPTKREYCLNNGQYLDGEDYADGKSIALKKS